MLKSDLCDYSDAYIVKGTIIIKGRNNRNIRKRSFVFKNNAPFINCISKIINVLVGNTEDLDVVIPMYNLIEYSKNYQKTTGSLWDYYRDEPNIHLPNNSNANPLTNSASLKYKSSITGKILNNKDDSEENNNDEKRILKLFCH